MLGAKFGDIHSTHSGQTLVSLDACVRTQHANAHVRMQSDAVGRKRMLRGRNGRKFFIEACKCFFVLEQAF